MRCSSCKAIAKMHCKKCNIPACRDHCNAVFDEATRSFVFLCGACYATVRRTYWVKQVS